MGTSDARATARGADARAARCVQRIRVYLPITSFWILWPLSIPCAFGSTPEIGDADANQLPQWSRM